MTTTKADLMREINDLNKKIEKLKETKMSKAAISATRAAVVFLKENVDDIVSVDMDTGYGHITFKMNR